MVNAEKKEAPQMPSPRWLAILIVPMMVGAALVSSAAVASADATDDTYRAQLRALGLTWSPDRDQAVIAVAQIICYAHARGHTPDAIIANDIHTILGPTGVTVEGATSMVSLAISTYCPS
jgi:hypothetical protein